MSLSLSELAQRLQRMGLVQSRNEKLLQLQVLFRESGERDRGPLLALLLGEVRVPGVAASTLRKLVRAGMDAELFDWSYDYVGDLAETLAWLLPEHRQELGGYSAMCLNDLLVEMEQLSPLQRLPYADRLLKDAPREVRWLFVKLVTGSSLRVGVSVGLAKVALAWLYERRVEELEEVWGRFAPPYRELFDWLEGRAELPDNTGVVVFVSPMLAVAMDESALAGMEVEGFAAEWKWDGVRVQLAAGQSGARLYSRTGEVMDAAFPDVLEHSDGLQATVDGELLVRRGDAVRADLLQMGDAGKDEPGDFSDLQKRLNRRSPSRALLHRHPAFLCVYDLLIEGGEDLRGLVFRERRKRLEEWFRRNGLAERGWRLSPLVEVVSWRQLRQLRDDCRRTGMEGLMLKRWDSCYEAGRKAGLWFKWKRDPLVVDAVVMYARRGHGKRASFYSDFTFGLWQGEGSERELLPVGSAYSGFSDAELEMLDRWVREHARGRFGTVRPVPPGLVLEIAFDAVRESVRHKSGLALRFPRIHRIRWDKPAAEADELETLRRMVTRSRPIETR